MQLTRALTIYPTIEFTHVIEFIYVEKRHFFVINRGQQDDNDVRGKKYDLWLK